MRFVPLALLLLSLCAELVGAQVVPFTTIPVGNAPGTVLVANGLVWTVDFGSNTVSVIDPVTWTKLEDVPTGAGPRAIVLDDVYKKLYVANAAGDSVTVIDAVTRSVVKTIALPAGSEPWHLKFFQSRVYVVLHGSNRLAIIHTYYDTVEASFATGVDPRQVCVESFGHLYAYVVNFGSNNVTVIDVVAGAEAPGSPVAVGLGPNSCAAGGGTYVARPESFTGRKPVTTSVPFLGPSARSIRRREASPRGRARSDPETQSESGTARKCPRSRLSLPRWPRPGCSSRRGRRRICR